MTQHPITPPPELVQEWARHILTPEEGSIALDLDWFATQAARWGANQELEACCEWFNKEGWNLCHPTALRAARRPKPLSLKERALAELEILRIDANTHGLGFDAPAISRALEQLDD
jgi:hypothetical protein